MTQTIADAELLQSNYEKIRDSGGDDISFEEYIENLKRSPPIPGQYEDMIDTDNPFASADEEFDIDPAVPYDVYDDIRQETPKLGVGSDYDKDFETYLGGDPFIDQPAPYRDPIMDMVGTNLGGGGGGGPEDVGFFEGPAYDRYSQARTDAYADAPSKLEYDLAANKAA